MLDANMGLSVTDGYAGGDFNGDGVVNSDDVALFQLGLASYNASVGNPLPEPAFASVMGLMVIALQRWRGRTELL